MKVKNKISIVLPVYNGEKTISKAIDSIINQTYSNWELIIINDCSTDDTLEIVSLYESKDDRIHVYTNEKNLKLPKSLNVGFEKAKGDYYTWTSDDNTYGEKALEVLSKALDDNQDIDLVYSNFNIVEMDGTLRSEEKKAEPSELKYYNCIGACFLYRASLAHKIGEYDPELFLAEDYEYWIRAYLNGKLLHINDNLYDYGWHAGSLTLSRKSDIAHKTFEAKHKHWTALYEKCDTVAERIRFFDELLAHLDNEDELKLYKKIYTKKSSDYKKICRYRAREEKKQMHVEKRKRIQKSILSLMYKYYCKIMKKN